MPSSDPEPFDPASKAGMCGVYCGGCPAYRKRCVGCRSEEQGSLQKRTSKWSCKIRTCVKEKQLHHCGECETLPCSRRRRLDERYLGRYSINLVENCRVLQASGADGWVARQLKKYTCPHCGRSFSPYDHRCLGCHPKREKIDETTRETKSG